MKLHHNFNCACVCVCVFSDVPDWKRPPKLCHKHQHLADAEKNKCVTVKPAPKPCVSSEELVGQRTEKGYLVNVNDELIALFKVMGKVYAVRDSCPHAGGCCYNLYLNCRLHEWIKCFCNCMCSTNIA